MNQTELRHRIETLARSGRSAGAIATILAREGFTDGASRASVGRVLAELRGPVRSPRVTRSRARSPEPPPSDSLVARILREWCDGQEEPEAALELVLADLEAHAPAGRPARTDANQGDER